MCVSTLSRRVWYTNLGFNTKDAKQPTLGNPALWLVDYDSIANRLLKG